MSLNIGDGLRSSFFYGRPGAPFWNRPSGANVYYRPDKLTQAALYVRQNGPAYLKYLPMNEIWSALQKFVQENYWHLARNAFQGSESDAYSDLVSLQGKAAFAEALSDSEIFHPRIELTVFPLVTVKVEANFDSESFFIVEPSSLGGSRLPPDIHSSLVAAEYFPPLAEWKYRKEKPTSWLGVRSPAFQASNKMKASILGALALTPLPQYRHMFSGRDVFGGRCTISEKVATSWGEAHTPPLMHDIVISEDDHAWLNILAAKMLMNERTIRRELRGLEYFYRAWDGGPSERFPILCMALDAIFGESNHATQAVIDRVREVLGSQVDGARLRLLMQLRASVIHGAAPDVYDSKKYGRYYASYGEDPIEDMELVVAACLRSLIFGAALKEHSDPNAAAIAQARAKGYLANVSRRSSILQGDTFVS
jgi:hypothetical protein